ncbi:MAG: hypothetical protein PUB21_06345 [Bacteroidales bacterium]|nr:hypothetical protein [Bacteroidales bacterium]
MKRTTIILIYKLLSINAAPQHNPGKPDSAFGLQFILYLFFAGMLSLTVYAQPIRQHPDNPHYLMYKGKPLLIVTSAEHYGAILNPAFDYIKYLNTLKKEGMNYTRIFTGAMYFEIEGDFGITDNTLAPARGTALTPWKRSAVKGNNNGGYKFDLDNWDESYFERLRNFISEAQKRDIIVEVTLFTSIYNDRTWSNCPVNPANNINGTDITDYKLVHTLHNGKLMRYQEKAVKQIVQELNSFDNIIYEIQNEPWADQTSSRSKPNVWEKSALDNWQTRIDLASEASLEWQQHIASLIKKEEQALPKKHLIAQNYCNYLYAISNVSPDISIMNFHYAWPEAVALNYERNKVIGFDESGFNGSADDTYRQQAWIFLCSGGGLFNSLDYSFAVGYEDGTLAQSAPGGGSSTLRSQLYILRNVFENLNFIRFKPDHNLIALAPDTYAHAISDGEKEFLLYLNSGEAKEIQIRLPNGFYAIKWIVPATGNKVKETILRSEGSGVTLQVPPYKTDIAATIIKQ